MIALLWVAGYAATHLACVLTLSRLRPEWVYRLVPVDDEDLFPHFTESEHKRWNAEREKYYPYGPDKRVLAKIREDAAARGKLALGRWGAVGDEGMWIAIFAVPMALAVLPVSIALRASARSLNDKTTARAELEKDLAAARKEIDELLGRRGPA